VAEDQPSDPLVIADGRPWDLLVVGGGTAGLVAAHTAAELGATALLVERHRTGGDCLWTGCVPSKSLLASAHAAAAARAASRLGVSVVDVQVDFPAVMRHVREAIATIEPVDSPAALRAAGVAVAHGTLSFTGSRSAQVDGQSVAFTQAVVATGSAPVMPDVPGLMAANPLTSDSVWDLEELPARLLVVGGGPVGCELGQGFARLGSRVVMIETGPRLLGREHPAAADLVREALAADGVDVRTGSSLVAVAGAAGDWTARLDSSADVGFDRVLVAIGRRPRTEHLALSRAGVRLTGSGHVKVDRRLRTTNPRIWAAGDVTGHPPFTHSAGVHAALAASNAVLGLWRTVDPETIPRVTYTQPEVAAFGISGDAAAVTIRRTDHRDVDRAITSGATGGFTELALNRRGRVVGATTVGPRAGEVLAEAVLAARAGIPARRIAGIMHAYPTWSDGVWKGAVDQSRAELSAPVVRRGIQALAAVRRRWMQRGG
jgi:pyruvate/2-oxoglutarate dehydrogenase complex dihydrolipoamide dehydrogenase (E3) component